LNGGTINLATGLVQEELESSGEFTVDGQTFGPFTMGMNVIGVQRWANITTSPVTFFGQGRIPDAVPYFGGGMLIACASEKQSPPPPVDPTKPGMTVEKLTMPELDKSINEYAGTGVVKLNKVAVQAGYTVSITVLRATADLPGKPSDEIGVSVHDVEVKDDGTVHFKYNTLLGTLTPQATNIIIIFRITAKNPAGETLPPIDVPVACTGKK